MRTNDVQTLATWCLGRGCNHFRILNVSDYPDDMPVPSFEPRLRCERCGHPGADARPIWNEIYSRANHASERLSLERHSPRAQAIIKLSRRPSAAPFDQRIHFVLEKRAACQ